MPIDIFLFEGDMNINTNEIRSNETFGERIRYVRRDLIKLSRAVFSDRYNIVLRTLVGWESGRSLNLSKHFIEKLLTAFLAEGIVCSKQWLLTGEGDHPTEYVNMHLRGLSNIFLNKVQETNEQALLKRVMDNQEKNIFIKS